MLLQSVTRAQLPVEVFAGHQKITADIMFFRFINNKEGNHSKFLFFNRNRASIDYAMTKTTDLPQFGFTEAISYNAVKAKGFAPVLVVSILNRGVYPKAGLQFAKINADFTVFSWVVAEVLDKHAIDWFFLGRYTPKLTGKLDLFTQLELVNTFPTVMQNSYSFTQRLRIGLKISLLQFGMGIDMLQVERNEYTKTRNIGAFVRYEF